MSQVFYQSYTNTFAVFRTNDLVCLRAAHTESVWVSAMFSPQRFCKTFRHLGGQLEIIRLVTILQNLTSVHVPIVFELDNTYHQVMSAFLILTVTFPGPVVSAGSPARGGDVAVYVFEINQSSLSTLFYSIPLSISVFMTLSTVFQSMNNPDNSLLSHCSSCLIFALLVFSIISL